MSKIFALHPGIIESKNVPQLLRLYQIPHGRQDLWVVWDDEREETYRGRRHEHYVHLYPLFSGRYFDALEVYSDEVVSK
jgi:hypothetical protein